MRDGRFVELPALRQTGLYRRAALELLKLPPVVRGQLCPPPTLQATDGLQATVGLQATDGLQATYVGTGMGTEVGMSTDAAGAVFTAGAVDTPTEAPVVEEVYRDLVEWPVDSDFWFRWSVGTPSDRHTPPLS